MSIFSLLSSQPLVASLQVLGLTLAAGFVYVQLTKDRPYPGFPVVALEGKKPKESFFHLITNCIHNPRKNGFYKLIN